MKKYKLEITHAYIVALCHWVEEQLEAEAENPSFDIITRWLVLRKWYSSEQVRNLCLYHFVGKKKLAIKIEVASALAALIVDKEIDNSSYLGNYLRIALGEIHQFFNLKK